MNDYNTKLVESLFECKKYNAVSEFSSIRHPDRPELVITEYCGYDVRLYKDNDGKVKLMLPYRINCIQEGCLASAISNGTIFDDADNVDNNSKYIELRTIPYNAMINSGKDTPKELKTMISMVIGKMDDDGTFEVDGADVTNGHNFVKDVVCCKDKNCSVKNTINNYLDTDSECDLPKDIRDRMVRLKDDVNNIRCTSNESCLSDNDFDEFKFEKIEEGCDECDENKVEQESFISKKPKKLKPIPRDVIAYITSEMNDIRDSNDQAMLSGYTCAKLELVDFYLTVLDTNDVRYIVPHDRSYLEQMQTALNNLLEQILRIKPINRNDRIWRLNVNYPERRGI